MVQSESGISPVRNGQQIYACAIRHRTDHVGCEAPQHKTCDGPTFGPTFQASDDLNSLQHQQCEVDPGRNEEGAEDGSN
jgi:hypothetical protein